MKTKKFIQKMKSSEQSDYPFKDEIVDSQKCQSQLNSLKKENRDLQVRFKDFVCQSKQLRMETEKLIHKLGMCKEQNATLSSNLKTESDKSKNMKRKLFPQRRSFLRSQHLLSLSPGRKQKNEAITSQCLKRKVK